VTPEFASLPVPLGDEESLRPFSPIVTCVSIAYRNRGEGWLVPPTTLGSIMPVERSISHKA